MILSLCPLLLDRGAIDREELKPAKVQNGWGNAPSAGQKRAELPLG